jgi:hypothetical protein
MSSSIIHLCACSRCRTPEPHRDRELHREINLLVSRESNGNRGAAQAAATNGAGWISLAGMAGYQVVKRSWSVPSRVRVRVCRSR